MAFTGKATYDNHSIIGEDVSSILLLMDPTETPLLSLLPSPRDPATNTLHQWTEEFLVPDRVVASTAVNSVAVGAITLVGINGGYGDVLQVGMQVEPEPSTGVREVGMIASIVGANTIGIQRGLNGVINSLAVGGELFVIATSELEGSETDGDVSVPRSRRTNYTQIFKKPVLISGTDQAVITAPDVGSEFDHQTTLRTIELVKDLEKAIIRGVSVNTIGTSANRRSMNGLRALLTAINSNVASNSFNANPIEYINDLMQQAWNRGARDLNVLLAGAQWKRDISGTNVAKLQVEQDERGIERLVEYVLTDFGQMRVVLTPWMPDRAVLGLATGRIFPVPLRGRSFQRELLAKSGDYMKGHIVGEYTLEVHHPDKMFAAYA